MKKKILSVCPSIHVSTCMHIFAYAAHMHTKVHIYMLYISTYVKQIHLSICLSTSLMNEISTQLFVTNHSNWPFIFLNYDVFISPPFSWWSKTEMPKPFGSVHLLVRIYVTINTLKRILITLNCFVINVSLHLCMTFNQTWYVCKDIHAFAYL